MAAALMTTLSARAAFTVALMAGISRMTPPVSSLVGMEVIERLFAALWHRSAVTLTRIIPVVHMAVESARAAEPWARADEQSAAEPIRAIVAIGRTTVGGIVEVAVGTVGSHSDVNANLSLSLGSGSRQAEPHDRKY